MISPALFYCATDCESFISFLTTEFISLDAWYSGVMNRHVLGFHGENGWTLNNRKFDNSYYNELVGPGSTLQDQVERAPNWQQVFVENSDLDDTPSRFQFQGYPQGKKIVMMQSDIALVRQLHNGNLAPNGKVACQFVSRGGQGVETCPMSRIDLFAEMVKYRNDNRVFLQDFRDALIKMIQQGYKVDTTKCDVDGVCPLIKL
jgi:hypothetical protein